MKIHDNGIDREMTTAEISAYELTVAAFVDEQQKAQEAEAAALEARKAPLRKLGLSDEEINTVLGL